MSMDFKVSIIIPIYNVEPYILECLESVANQTIADKLECILVDDCGTDNSVSVAESFLKSYSGGIHFELLHHQKNGGLSAARNTGVHAAHGEYLYFLDSDDMIIPRCMEILVEIADRHHADVVIGSYATDDNRMSQFDKIDYPECVSDKGKVKRMMLDYEVIPVTAANRLIRRELMVKNNLYFKEGIIHEDNYWTFFLAKHVERMAICKEKVYYYRSTPGSITNKVNVEKETFAYHSMIEDFCSHIDSFERNAQKRIIFCLILWGIGSGYYKDNADRQHLIHCLKKQDTFINGILLSLIFQMKGSFLRAKLINLLMKIYQKGG